MPDLRIRLAGYQPTRSLLTRALHRLADGVRETVRTPVELIDDITALGRRADDLLAMTEGDGLDICYFSSSYLAPRVPSLALFDRPFHFANRAEAHRELAGETAQRIADEVAHSTEFRLLGLWDNGVRHISNRRRPIRNPDDCKGLRIRTVNNPAHQAFFRRLGFEPVFIDIRDMPRAVADGTVDAQENPLTNVVNFDLQRHHRFISLTGHFFGVALLLANRRRFEAWPAEVRRAIDAAAGKATRAQWLDAAAEDDLCFRSLSDEGVQFVAGGEIDRVAFARAAD